MFNRTKPLVKESEAKAPANTIDPTYNQQLENKEDFEAFKARLIAESNKLFAEREKRLTAMIKENEEFRISNRKDFEEANKKVEKKIIREIIACHEEHRRSTGMKK